MSIMAMEPGTTEFKPESERVFIQPSQADSTSSDDSGSQSDKTLLHRDKQPLSANGEPAAGRNENEPMGSSISEDDGDQLSIAESHDLVDDISTHGWVGNEDQMADLILLLRWAQAYRVTIEEAGRMLKMQPEIVSRAAVVHAQSASGCGPHAGEWGVGRSTRPVIKHWMRLGPLCDFAQ